MIKMIRQGPGWALIRASWLCVQRASCETNAAKSLRSNELDMSGGENVLFTFAKAFHKGSGIWLVSGYAYDGSDLSRALDRMKEGWRASYGPGLPWSLTRPCGAWFRACASVSSPRQRLLTMASCHVANAA